MLAIQWPKVIHLFLSNFRLFLVMQLSFGVPVFFTVLNNFVKKDVSEVLYNRKKKKKNNDWKKGFVLFGAKNSPKGDRHLFQENEVCCIC